MVEVCKVAIAKNANKITQAGSTPHAEREKNFIEILAELWTQNARTKEWRVPMAHLQ
jgi:hypothetical protein